MTLALSTSVSRIRTRREGDHAVSLFVVYGFDTAGTFGEETVDASRMAPRASRMPAAS